MKKWIVLVLLGGILSPCTSPAIDLKQSKFTQVVNNVEIISAANQSRHAAAVNDVFSMPDVLRTGPDSRAELDATDGTITRVGANTIFSFNSADRTINLQQGSLLFHSPKGKGGGTIRTGSATASVIGTTIIVTATPNGGFKLLDLEGQAEVRFLNGLNQTLEPGQMTFILPGGAASPVLVFRLDSETKGSALVSGFDTPLDSQSKINSEITQQLLQILNGTAADTGYVVGNNATANSVQVVVQNINNTPSSSTPPPPPPPPPIFSTDGSVVGNDRVSTLPVDYTPLDPAHTFDSSITPLTSDDIAGINGVDSFYQGLLFLGLTEPTSPASGFFGNNIDIDSANVDLSSFAGKSDFDIMAVGNLKIWQSVNFNDGISLSADNGPQLPDVVSLIAGGQMLIASGSILEADTTTFGLVADGFGTLDTSSGLADSDYPNALENIHFANNDGAIQVLSLSDFTLEDYSTINAGNDGTGLGLEIESEGGLTLGNSGLVDTIVPLGGSTWDVSIYAGGDVDLLASDGIGAYDTYVYSAGGDINITAGGTVDLEDTYVYAAGDVNILGGGTVTLGQYSSETVEAAGNVYLTSDNTDVDIYGDDIYADDGGVSISAGGNVNLSSGELESGYDSDNAYDVDINAGGTIGLEDAFVYSTGNINMDSSSGDINITGGSTISANGSVSIQSGRNLNIDGISVNAVNGDADLCADYGSVTWNASPVSAYGSVMMDGLDDVTVTGTAITSQSSDVTVASVNGFLTLDNESAGDTISAGGSVFLSGKTGVDIVNYAFYAIDGDLNVSSGAGSISIADTTANAAGDVNISSAETIGIASGPSYPTRNVDIENTSINAGGNVNIEAYDTLYLGWYGGGNTIDANGVVNLASDIWDVDIDGYEIYAGGSDINGNGINISARGNVDIEDGDEIYAYDGGISITGNGSVYFYNDDIEAGEDTENLYDLDITSAGSTVDIDDTYLYASGNMIINSGDTLTLEDASYLEAGNGDVSLVSDNADVDIYDSEVYSDNGNVTINALGGTVDLEDGAYISAQGDVGIEGGGTLYLGWYDGYYENNEIDAQGTVNLTSDSADVDIGEYSIYAYGSDESGIGINIYAGGNVDMDDAYLYADVADVNIESGGTLTLEDGSEIDAYGANGISLTSDSADVDVSDSSLYAYNAGVNINAEGNAEIEDGSYIYAYDDVNITSSTGSATAALLSCGRGNVDINGSYIYAGYDISYDESPASYDGGSVNITAWNGHVDLYDDDIEAYSGEYSDGDVNIRAYNGSVDLDDVYDLYAAGMVNIEGYNTVTLEDGSDLEAYNGDITLTSDTADVDIYDSEIHSDNGNVTINALGGTVDLEDGAYISAQGDVGIESGGTLYLGWYDGYYENNEIDAQGTVNLTSDNADVDIGEYSIYAYGSDESGIGINIYAGGNVDMDDTYLYAVGDANIESSDTLTLEDSSEIKAYGSDGISLVSDTADVDVSDSSLYAYNAGVNISAEGNAEIEDNSGIFANDDVDITSSTEYVPAAALLSCGRGNVDINDSTIKAGYNPYAEDGYALYASYDGGSVNIIAWNGHADLYDDQIYAYSGVNSDGDIIINANGSVDVDDTGLYADGGINIEGVNTVTVEDGGDLEAYNGDVSLKSDNSFVQVNDSEIYSYGDVIVSAADYVYASDAYIEAGYDSDTGDVDINALNGTADFENTYVSAEGGVYIESSDTLTLNNSESNGGGSGYNEVYAYGGPVDLTSDNADVDITGYDIYAYGGDLNISAGAGVAVLGSAPAGSVDIENAYFQVEGDVNVTAAGNARVNNSYFDMYGGGDINVNAGGNIDVLYTEGSGSGSVSLIANGYVNVYDDTMDISSLNVTAGTTASVGADQYADIYDSTIKANGGGVNITGNSAGVDIDDTSITATGDIDVTAGNYGYYDYARSSSGGHSISSYVPLSAPVGGFVTLGTFTPATFILPSPVSASSDNIVENGANIEDTGTLDLEANIDANINNNSSLVSDSGDVMVNSAGTLEIDSSHLEANDGSVYLVAAGKVSISDSLNESYIYAAYNGDVDIKSSGGAVDIADAYIYGDNNVNIDSFDTLTMGNSTRNTIEAYNGDLSLTSDNADVYIYNYYIYSARGNVNISAAGKVSVLDSEIDTGSYSEAGDLNIQALAGTVDIEGTYINIAGNLGIYSFDTLTLGINSGNEIDANGWVNLSSMTGDVDVDNYSIYTYGSDIDGNGVTISAAAGSLSLSRDWINAYNSGDMAIAALGAGETADIDDTYIFADRDVTIESSGTLTFQDSSEIESYGDNGISLKSDNADVDVYGSSLYAYNGDVDITAPGTSGSIDMEDTYISASGDVNIESGGVAGDVLLGLTDLMDNGGGYNSGNVIEAGGSVSLMSDNKNVVVADYSIGESSPIGGDVTISAPNGTVGLENTHVNADGDVSITAGGTSGSYYPGDVSLGLLDYQFDYGYDNNEIDAGGSVLLQSGNADVLVYGYSIYAYGDWDAGDVDIYAYNGQIDLDDSHISAWGDADIESGGTLTVEDNSEIDSYGYNGISLTSDSADVDVYDSSLYAYYGNVDITAVSDSAAIDLENDNISAYGNVNIESDGTLTLGDNSDNGFDTIYAASGVYLSSDSGDVDVYNSTIKGGFDGTVDDMTIENGSALMSGGVANLDAYGAEISIYAYGNVDIYYTTIKPGGGINISDSSIIADGGDINGSGVNIYSDGSFYVGGYSDTLYEDDIEGNNISISGSTITANNGGVSIVNDASFSTRDSVGFDLESSTVVYGDITISGGSTITANSGSVDIETASSDLSGVYVDEGSSLSVGDISIYNSTITAIGGDVTISAGGYLKTGAFIVGDYLKTGGLPGGVSISADGDVSLYGYSGATVDYTTAEAGGKVGLESDYDVYAYESSLTADNLDADIYAGYGNVDLEYSTATATLGNVDIEAGHSDAPGSETLTLDGDTVMAGGSVTLGAPGAVGVTGGSLTGNGSVNVNAGTGITINGVAVTADDTTYGNITLTSTTGQTTIENGSSVKAFNLTVNSPDGILIDGSSGGSFSGNTMNLTAGNGDASGGPTIAVQNADFSAFTILNIAAHTLDLFDVAFGGESLVTLGSWNGHANIENGVIPGEVNLRGVTLGGAAIVGQSQINYAGSVLGKINVYSTQ